MSKSAHKLRVHNITRVFRTASPMEIEEGGMWYQDAHDIAQALATAYALPVSKVAGIMAALSPLNSWGANVNLTIRFLKSAGHLDKGYLGVQLDKARRIYALTGYYKTQEILDILNGDKTKNFFLSIKSAGAMGVTVDRHAYSIAKNYRFSDGLIPTLKGERYDEVVRLYVRAAEILSEEYDMPITPAQVQAVTWVIWRRRFWSHNAFNGHMEVL